MHLSVNNKANSIQPRTASARFGVAVEQCPNDTLCVVGDVVFKLKSSLQSTVSPGTPNVTLGLDHESISHILSSHLFCLRLDSM